MADAAILFQPREVSIVRNRVAISIWTAVAAALVLGTMMFILGILIGVGGKRELAGRLAAGWNKAGIAFGFKTPFSAIPERTTGNQLAVTCPPPRSTILLVTAGQSNAGNTLGSLSATHLGENVYVWFDNKCWVAQDPVPGARGDLGSLWPALGRDLAKRTGRSILFVNGAIGGSQISHWLDPRSHYSSALLARVHSAQQAGYRPALMLWHQGESEMIDGMDAKIYEKKLTLLTGHFLAAMPKVRFYLFAASRCYEEDALMVGKQPDSPIVIAQRAVARKSNRMIAGMNTDTLGTDYRWDRCHFNDWGRRVIVDRVKTQITPLLMEREQPENHSSNLRATAALALGRTVSSLSMSAIRP